MSSKFYTFSCITVKPCLTATSEIRLLVSTATVFWTPGNTALHFLVKKPRCGHQLIRPIFLAHW